MELFVCDMEYLPIGMEYHRRAIHLSMSHPAQVIPSVGRAMNGRWPAIALVYKLQENMGHLVNIYDLYQLFVECSEGSKQGDKILQTKFFAALQELELMGFIKFTNQKTDHFVRLVFDCV
jgi:hypothetical protein